MIVMNFTGKVKNLISGGVKLITMPYIPPQTTYPNSPSLITIPEKRLTETQNTKNPSNMSKARSFTIGSITIRTNALKLYHQSDLRKTGSYSSNLDAMTK